MATPPSSPSPSPSGPLDAQVAIVTGASSGIGRSTALALAREGCHLALLARNKRDLEALKAEIGTAREVLVLPGDLAEEAVALAAVGSVLNHFGRVDLLVNNAGTDVPGLLVDISHEDWDRVLNVNLRAPFVLAKAVFPSMQKAQRGTIINISSVAGKRGWAKAGAYCASKFGLSGFTQALAAEGKPYGIRACVLFPGAVDSNWGRWSFKERQQKKEAERLETAALPPDEVAQLIVWIASAPAHLVLNEVVVTPLNEQGWP